MVSEKAPNDQSTDELADPVSFNISQSTTVAEVKPDAIATFVGDKLGIPSNLRTSEEEKQVIAQQATKLFQQQIAGGGGPGQGGAPAAPSPPMPPQQEPAEAVEDEVSA